MSENFSKTFDPTYGSIPIPINEVIQKDINLSTIVAAALIDGGTPAAEYKIIIIPSTAPTPPGRSGINPIKVAITNTAAITPQGYWSTK